MSFSVVDKYAPVLASDRSSACLVTYDLCNTTFLKTN